MNFLIRNYAKLIKKGAWTIEQVPEGLREQVILVLETL